MSARSFDINTLNVKQTNITVEKSDANVLRVELHGHLVFSFFNNVIELSSCGYRTSTTKVTINRALSQLGLQDYGVFRKKGEWFLNTPKGTVEFKDGMNVRI